jgi:hypothetical protein
VIATDAAISIVIGVVKISVFGIARVITVQVIAFALLTARRFPRQGFRGTDAGACTHGNPRRSGVAGRSVSGVGCAALNLRRA